MGIKTPRLAYRFPETQRTTVWRQDSKASPSDDDGAWLSWIHTPNWILETMHRAYRLLPRRFSHWCPGLFPRFCFASLLGKTPKRWHSEPLRANHLVFSQFQPCHLFDGVPEGIQNLQWVCDDEQGYHLFADIRVFNEIPIPGITSIKLPRRKMKTG